MGVGNALVDVISIESDEFIDRHALVKGSMRLIEPDEAITLYEVTRFEPQMLEYDRFDHGRYRVGLGDWNDKIRSGVIHPATPAPEDVPEGLHELCRAWGYDAGPLPAPQR